MQVTYSISKNELDLNFLESIKKTFKSDRISIQIEDEIDETERIIQNKDLYNKLISSTNKLNDERKSVVFENEDFINQFKKEL